MSKYNKIIRLIFLLVILLPFIIISGALIIYSIVLIIEESIGFTNFKIANIILISIIVCIISIITYIGVAKVQKKKLLNQILSYLDLDYIDCTSDDYFIKVASSRTANSYSIEKFFKEYNANEAYSKVSNKINYYTTLYSFMSEDNKFRSNFWYKNLYKDIKNLDEVAKCLRIHIQYISPAGKSQVDNIITASLSIVKDYKDNLALTMSKSQYNKMIKSQTKEKLDNMHKEFYNKVNNVIDKANKYKEIFIIKEDRDRLDTLISNLFDKTVNSIQKIKNIDSEEWNLIEKYINDVDNNIDQIISKNKQIQDYYVSNDFYQIKNTVDNLMSTQKEFNEYIDEKAKAITSLFGTRIVRTETIQDDEYNYIHPYKKSITPFTAEVSASIFASAENSPLEYVVKNFYPDKTKYPEQIQKLHLLIEELETLKEAKVIIDNYKKDYQQYLDNVPNFIFQYDEDGFYSRLGFANISENILTVEYKFVYTSFGGKSQKSFTVPMTEETIIALISILENKLTMNTFSKEQRQLMTSKLRKKIKERDNYTCCHCGNSIWKEPNLLLEVDHIIPVADGGYTVEDNLQTLCWVCNRHKSKKSNDDIKTANINRESIQAQILAENAKK